MPVTEETSIVAAGANAPCMTTTTQISGPLWSGNSSI